MKHIIHVLIIWTLVIIQLHGSIYSSKDEYYGKWENSLVWLTSIPNVALTNNEIITINGTVNVSSGLIFKNNGSLIIEAGDTLLINGNLELGTNVLLTLKMNAVLIVNGNITTNNNLTVNSGGLLFVNGNFITGNGATIDLSSDNFYITGSNNLDDEVFSGTYSNIGSLDDFKIDHDILFNWIETNFSISLPIKLLYINAKLNNEYIIINWKTAIEINNDYFIIECSEDGITWIDIGLINSKGNSAYIQSYEFDYIHIKKNLMLYFRLSQIDYNGNLESFNIISFNYITNKCSYEYYDILGRRINDNVNNAYNICISR